MIRCGVEDRRIEVSQGWEVQQDTFGEKDSEINDTPSKSVATS